MYISLSIACLNTLSRYFSSKAVLNLPHSRFKILMIYYFEIRGLQLRKKSAFKINHYGLAKSKINVWVIIQFVENIDTCFELEDTEKAEFEPYPNISYPPYIQLPGRIKGIRACIHIRRTANPLYFTIEKSTHGHKLYSYSGTVMTCGEYCSPFK